MQIHGAAFGIEELLEEAHRLQMNLPALNGVGPASKETFRYWVKQGLIAPRLTRGRGTGYPASLAERMAFIRLLQKEFRLSLRHIRKVLAEISEETISRTVRGEEPIEIINHLSPEAKERMEYGEQVINLMESSASLQSPKEESFEDRLEEWYWDQLSTEEKKKRLTKKPESPKYGPVYEDDHVIERDAVEAAAEHAGKDQPLFRNETEDVLQELRSRQRATERQLQELLRKKSDEVTENSDLLRMFIDLLNKKGTETNYLYRADYDFEKMKPGRKYYWGSL